MAYRMATIVLPVLLLTCFAAAQCEDLDNGDCCEVNTTSPGCSDAACCEAVCDIDPFCCQEHWDAICVMHAEAECFPLCGSCLFSQGGNCCEANGTPGCDDEACCEAVCAVDLSCCHRDGGEWSESCAELAQEHCPELEGCRPPPDPACGDADAGDCCAAHGTPYCNNTECCSAVCDIDPYCCDTDCGEWDACCVNLAAEHCPLLSGCHIPGDVQHPECAGAQGDCCTSNGSPGCEDPTCCNVICSLDPFCCNVTWDQICANASFQFCHTTCHGIPPAPPPSFSCDGNCGGAAPSGCWCDEACCSFGDCCTDKGNECQGCQVGTGPPQFWGDWCFEVGCGGKSSAGCACDAGCFERGDCCSTICLDCPDFDGCTVPNPADLTGNGVVGVTDLLFLLNNWGE